MSITQTYLVAHLARSKLSKEAGRGDHDLRLLVGHANLLDGLMLDLANAEKEQESWFDMTVKSAAKASEEPKHIQWVEPTTLDDTVTEDVFEESSDSESDSDDDEDEIHVALQTPIHKAPQPPTTITLSEIDDDEEMEDDFEDDLALTRTSSAHPPELLHEDSDSDSEDDSMPPSPPQTEIPLDAFSEKQRQAIATTSYYQPKSTSLPTSDQASFFENGYYLPQRQPPAIAAC